MTTVAAEAAGARTPQSMWWVTLLEGIAAVVIGLLVITDPSITLLTLTVFLGVYWLISGIFDLVRMFTDHTDWGWRLLTGVLGILAGILVVRNPLWATVLVPVTMVWVLGLLGIVIGAVGIVRAFRGSGWGAGILGALSLILGLILLAGNLVATTIVVVSFAAACAMVGGVAAIIYSFYLRRAPAL